MYVWNKFKCFVWGKICFNCGILNYFVVVCKNKLFLFSLVIFFKFFILRYVCKLVYVVEDFDFDEYVVCVDVKEYVCVVENFDCKDKLFVVMLLNGYRVLF